MEVKARRCGVGAKGEAKALVDVIPDVFYDVIGRLPAGAAVLAGCGWAVFSSDVTRDGAKIARNLSQLSTGSVILILTAGVLFSHSAALLLNALARFIGSVCQPKAFADALRALPKEEQMAVALWISPPSTDACPKEGQEPTDSTPDERLTWLLRSLSEWEQGGESRLQFYLYERQLHFGLKAAGKSSPISSKMRAEASLTCSLAAAFIWVLLFAFVYYVIRGQICDRGIDFIVFAAVGLPAMYSIRSRSLACYSFDMGLAVAAAKRPTHGDPNLYV